jgi:septal ring factor EnvC (AmiA/AmiB activator)
MGLMDKIKTVAQDVTTETKNLAATAQVKVDETKLGRERDKAAKELGYLVYRERTEGTPAGSQADSLVATIADLDVRISAAAAQAEAKRQQASGGGAQSEAVGSPGPAPRAHQRPCLPRRRPASPSTQVLALPRSRRSERAR